MPFAELDLPARRVLQPIRDQLSAVTAGALYRATFSSTRYLAFSIEGPVIQSPQDSHIGGSSIGSSASLPADLHRLESIEALTPVVANAAQSDVRHGDIVRGRFVYNDAIAVVVVGQALEVERSGLLVGGWLLDGPRVDGIELLVSASDSDRPLPGILPRLKSSLPPAD